LVLDSTLMKGLGWCSQLLDFYLAFLGSDTNASGWLPAFVVWTLALSYRFSATRATFQTVWNAWKAK